MPRGGKRGGAGRPAGARDAATIDQKLSIATLAREHTETAVNALAAIASKGQSESARVAAASAILDRGYGKPAQAVEHTGIDSKPIDASQISEFEAIRRIAFAIELAKRQGAGEEV